LIIHLGMSGSLVIANGQYERKKHDHLVITLSNEYKIIFNDPRRFGLIDVCNTEGFEKLDYIKGLGPEPFDSNCTVQYLKTKFSKRSISIKQALMDNKILVGIGNIYASEILFLASVSPLRKANMITNPEIKKIHKAIDIILSKAINAGGSTLKDYKKADGTIGGFQNKFVVYGKQDEQCSRCKSLIKSVNQGGRRSFYCSNCQS